MVGSSATSLSSLQMKHQQQQQQGLPSPVRDVNTLSPSASGGAAYSLRASEHDGRKSGVGVRAGGAVAGIRRRNAWEQRPGQQQPADSETPPASSCDVSADEFPFPDTQGQKYNGGGAEDRWGQISAQAETDGIGAPTGEGGGSAHGKDGASVRAAAAAAAVTRRPSRSAEKGTRRLSRNGSGSNSHERLHMHTFSSRRRSSGGSSFSFGSPDRGPSSPGWSSYARRLSGGGGGDATEGGGGIERDGADRTYQSVSGGVSSTTSRHLAQNKDNTFDHAPLPEAWAREGAGGEPQGSYEAPATQPQGARVAAAQGQQSDFDAAGREAWVENARAWGEEGARREAVGYQQRGEWKGGGVGGSRGGVGGGGVGGGGGGGGTGQADERMVDEDAYRFRSFSEEV